MHDKSALAVGSGTPTLRSWIVSTFATILLGFGVLGIYRTAADDGREVGPSEHHAVFRGLDQDAAKHFSFRLRGSGGERRSG